ncbi:Peptidase S74 domain-containing protein [Entamoeba marina]
MNGTDNPLNEIYVGACDVPRTNANRLKNWQCTYPSCNEPAKTRYNCYSHIWDTHLRYLHSDGANQLEPCYKDIKDKTKVKKLCDPYMLKLVITPYPFDFLASSQTQYNNEQQLNNDIQNVNNNTDPFFEILQMSEALKQLHVFGEVFAENGYLTRSDQRAKEDITTLHHSLDLIMQLRGVTYRYKNDDQKRFGFIAQELQQVVPTLVKEDESGLYIDTEGILPLLVEALKGIEAIVVSHQFLGNDIDELHKRVNNAMNHLTELSGGELLGTVPHSEMEIETEEPKPTIKSLIIQRIKHFMGPPPFILFALWYIIFSLFLCVVYSTLVIGFIVVITVGLYFIATSLLFTIILFLYYNFKSWIPFRVLSVLLLILQAFAIAVLVLSVIFQPIDENYFLNLKKNYQTTISEDVEVDLVLGRFPWNCYTPVFESHPPLPNGLSFNVDKSLGYLRLSGSVESIEYEEPVVQVSLEIICSGFIVVKYQNVTLYNCASYLNETNCRNSYCSYCTYNSTSSVCTLCSTTYSELCKANGGTTTCNK